MTPAILDHLWQSTLLALGAGLLAMALRKAPAGVRYGLWFAASLKFLVPFAALAALGRLLALAGLVPARTAPEAVMIERAARPLAQFPFAHDAALQAPLSPSASASAPLAHAAASAAPLHLVPILLAVWALGGAIVLIAWAIRWARVRRIVRSATPLAWSAPMPVLASSSLMEPGLVGFVRPVLVVPETLPERLTRSEIDAILAHEITHLRRRDNLTAAIHMLVEALFWFHPLVWWIGARLMEEREQACDEAVVAAGHSRAAYARGLVESCRLYLQSPLDCVAGASGSNLKMRVEAIMTAPATSPLSPLKKALLLAAGACAFATPVTAGLLSSPEGRKAVDRTTAMASSGLGGPAASPEPDDAVEGRPTVLARNEAVLAPALSVARLDTPQTPLSRDVAAPAAVAQEPAATSRAPGSAPAPQSVQLATAAPPRGLPSAASVPADPAEIRRKAVDFVQSYGAFTEGPIARSRQTGRWTSELCIRIVGLVRDEEEAVRARIAQVAKSVDLTVQPNDCPRSNIEIGFSTNPQAMLDDTEKRDPQALGDRTSDTRKVKAMTLPIQAWYMTNGVTFADAGGGGLKVNVVYQSAYPTQNGVDVPIGSYQGDAGRASAYPSTPSVEARASSLGRFFRNIFVIVDLRKTGNRPLGVIADYVAMLALSQPRDLGQCNVLPSITDLFAACPGRSGPDTLTAADAAYLTALYPQTLIGRQRSEQASVAQRVANILAGDQVASR